MNIDVDVDVDVDGVYERRPRPLCPPHVITLRVTSPLSPRPPGGIPASEAAQGE